MTSLYSSDHVVVVVVVVVVDVDVVVVVFVAVVVVDALLPERYIFLLLLEDKYFDFRSISQNMHLSLNFSKNIHNNVDVLFS
jgi:hypothetical protein